MHQSIPAAPSPPPPLLPAHPRALAFFSPCMANSRVWGLLSCQIPRGGVEKRGPMPHPPSTLQHFSLIAQSSSAILSILMCDYLFQFNVFLCNSGVKSSGLAPGLANARPAGSANFANAPPRDWQGGQMPRSSPGWGWGRWAQLELTDALSSWKLSSTSGSVKFVWISLDRRTRSVRLKIICEANVDLHMRRTELTYKKICMMMYI